MKEAVAWLGEAFLSFGWTDTASDIAVLVTAVAALLALNTWKKENIGRRRIELAEEALSLVFEARDIIRWVRTFDMGYQSESAEREPEEDETEEQKEARDRVYPVLKRYDENRDVFNRLGALRYRLAAYFGDEILDLIRDLHRVPEQVCRKAGILARLYETRAIRGTRDDKLEKRIEEAEAVVRETKDDEISREVERIVKRFEAICRPVLSR